MSSEPDNSAATKPAPPAAQTASSAHSDLGSDQGRQTPTVSAVMALYNRVNLMDASIQAVLDQDDPDFELIVIDDASTDGSWESAQRWAATDSRIRLDRFPINRGIAAVRNRGIELARGKYLATCDSDDLARPYRFRLQRAVLDTADDVVGVSGMVRAFVDDPNSEGWQLDYHYGLRDGRPPFPLACAMLRADTVRRFGYDSSLQVAEDLDLAYKLSTVGTFVDLPEVLIDYRIHKGGITSKQRTLERDNLRVQLRGLRLYKGKFSPRGYAVLCQSFFRLAMATLGMESRHQFQSRIEHSGGNQINTH